MDRGSWKSRVMNVSAISTLATSTLSAFGDKVLVVLTAVIGVAVAYYLFKFAVNAIWHFDGTTNWLGKHWSTWDHLTYKKWKGYNRMRSAKWNMTHTLQ